MRRSAAPSASRIAARLAATSPTRSTSAPGWRVSSLGADVEPDQLRLLGDAGAEAEAKVERHADHQRHVGAAEAGAAGAAEGELVIGRQAAAPQAVEEDRDAERLGQGPQLAPLPCPSRARSRP